ncbi:DNA-binding transcription factor yap1 [Basidiobolus ranarum]|uniref:DNA-binding transcription factor yap1 n=1 Tax=Basidiobolus ranarum TaxID=34480 RepID=A0ABR2WLE9_9FUNG
MTSPVNSDPVDSYVLYPVNSPEPMLDYPSSCVSVKRNREGYESSLTSDNLGKKPGRKPVATVPISKRQMQNREAQRLFRERKMKQQQHLYDRIKELEDIRNNTQRENHHLKLMAHELKVQNERLQTTIESMYMEEGKPSCPSSLEERDYKPGPLSSQMSPQLQGSFRYTNIRPPLNNVSTDLPLLTPEPVYSTAPKASKEDFRYLTYVTTPSNRPQTHFTHIESPQEDVNRISSSRRNSTLPEALILERPLESLNRPHKVFVTSDCEFITNHENTFQIHSPKSESSSNAQCSLPLTPTKSSSSLYDENLALHSKPIAQPFESMKENNSFQFVSSTNRSNVNDTSISLVSDNQSTFKSTPIPDSKRALSLNIFSEKLGTTLSSCSSVSRHADLPICEQTSKPFTNTTIHIPHTSSYEQPSHVSLTPKPISSKKETILVAKGFVAESNKVVYSTCTSPNSQSDKSHIPLSTQKTPDSGSHYSDHQDLPTTNTHDTRHPNCSNGPGPIPECSETNLEEDLSVEYLDQLVIELHDLCREMKEKAALSSEPFEFEWPCEEIDSKLDKMNTFKL